MKGLAEVYLAKAKARADGTTRRCRRSSSIFAISTRPSAGSSKPAWQPSRAMSTRLRISPSGYRRPIATSRKDLIAFYRALPGNDGLTTKTRSTSVASVLLSPHFLLSPAAVDQPCLVAETPRAVPSPITTRQPAELLPLVEHAGRRAVGPQPPRDLHEPEVLAAQARRMLTDDRVRGLATEFGGNWLDFRRFEEHNSVDRERFPRSRTSCGRRCSKSRSASSSICCKTIARCSTSLRRAHVRQSGAREHYGMPPVHRCGRHGRGWTAHRQPGRGGLLPMAVFLTRTRRACAPARSNAATGSSAACWASIPPPPPDRTRVAQRRSQARRADAPRSPCHREHPAVPAATSGSIRSAWRSKATARSASAANATSAAGPSTPAPPSPSARASGRSSTSSESTPTSCCPVVERHVKRWAL